jgi:hypothetical protein
MGQTTHSDEQIQTKGTSNFAGPGGVSVVHDLNWISYGLSIISTTDPSGAVGNIWITDITANSFVVRNSGSAVTAFTYVVNRT